MSNLPPAIREQAATVDAFDAATREAQSPAAQPSADAPAAPAAPAAPTPPATPSVSQTDFEKLQHQFQTLQGMWRAEKERNAENEERLRALEQPPAKPAEPPSKFESAITESDRETFGADLCSFITNQITAATSHVLSAMDARLATIEARLGEATTAAAAATEDTREVLWQKFLEQLDKRVRGWHEIQHTPEGKQFLGLRVPGTKELWNNVIQRAAQNMDVEATVEVFEAMFNMFPALRPKEDAAPPPPPPPGNPLENELAPARGDGGGPPATPPAKRTYKAKEYENETMRLVRLRQQRKDQEADALEAELDLALREKRVVP